ncbi:MAG TPA: flagellar basal-body rod protein FlgF [Candidatus Acidoferrales bacterium]|nr:flagellar basal-body rod protein FlgF [Candidatus Acidoferrales bacterium]
MYKALSGAVAQMERLEVAAQDLANVNTSGYKGQRLVFSEVLANRSAISERAGGLVAIGEQKTNFLPGEIQTTGNPFNLALDGNGFFVVRTPRGDRYTRSGSFTLKPDGTVVTPQGDALLGDSGPFQITGGRMEVSEDGTVTSNDGELGKLKIVRFKVPGQAVKEGANLFSTQPTNVQPAADVRVVQGGLEQSNVSPIDSMVSLISIQRQFEAYERAMGLMDSVTQKMISDAGN